MDRRGGALCDSQGIDPEIHPGLLPQIGAERQPSGLLGPSDNGRPDLVRLVPGPIFGTLPTIRGNEIDQSFADGGSPFWESRRHTEAADRNVPKSDKRYPRPILSQSVVAAKEAEYLRIVAKLLELPMKFRTIGRVCPEPEPLDVFEEKGLWSDLADNPHSFHKEIAVIRVALLQAHARMRLAWDPAGDQVDFSAICSKIHICNVALPDRTERPVGFQGRNRILVLLVDCDGVETCGVEPERLASRTRADLNRAEPIGRVDHRFCG